MPTQLAFNQINGSMINVRDYEAVGDDSTDNLIPFGNAVSRAISEQKPLYIPAGTYRCSARIDIDTTGVQDFAIIGDGRELSKIVFTGDTVGLDVTLDNAEYIDGTAFNIRGVSIITTQDLAAVAISVDGNNSAGFTAPGPIFHDVVMRGYDTASGWSKGLVLTDTPKTEIDKCYFLGKRLDKTATALEITGTGAGTDHIIRGYRATFFDKAISIGGTVEGVYCDSCVLISGQRGISWTTTAEEPLLNLNNSHINTNTYGVQMARANQSFITNNLIYQDPSGGTDWTGILVTESNHTQITGNTLHGWNVAGSRNGISIGTSSTYVNVDGNVIRAFSGSFPLDSGIIVDGTCSNIRVGDGNLFDNCTNDISNSSGTSVGVTFSDTSTETLTGGSPTETLDFTINTTKFSAKPATALLTQASGSAQILARYEYDDAASTATNARFTLYTADGANLPSGNVRFSFNATD